MATYENLSVVNFEAGADLSAKQYYFAKLGTVAGTVVVCGDGQNAVGVILDKPTAGQATAIAVGGKVRVHAGGTIAIGAPVASDANGKAVAAANGDYVLGVAVTAGADGSIVEVLFDKNGIDPA